MKKHLRIICAALCLSAALATCTSCAGQEATAAPTPTVSTSPEPTTAAPTVAAATPTPIPTPEPTAYAQAYIDVFASYFDIDPGLHEGMTYLAIDMDTLKNATDVDKEAIAEHFAKELSLEVMDASMQDLQEQGLVKEGSTIEGILLYVESVEETATTLTVEGVKYRSGLGANFNKSVLDKKDGEWVLRETEMVAIS